MDVPVTHVRGALVLDGHGAPSAMFDVVVLGDRLVLLAPDGEVAATLVDVLGGRTFLLDATFELRERESLAVRGEDAAEVVAAAGLSVVPGRCRLAGDLLLVSRPDGIDVLGPAPARAQAAAALRAAGAVDGDVADLEDLRIARGEPAWGREVAAPHLPEEVGLLPSHVHLAKGCYPGQEAVARMWMLGQPRRRLARVAVTGAVAPGWRTGSGRHQVEVTSVTSDARRALAFVPRDAAAGAVFEDEDGT
ncbi:MAG: tRNA-modifying protein YgfZ, partial [Candidatus Brocadiia bacterium]